MAVWPFDRLTVWSMECRMITSQKRNYYVDLLTCWQWLLFLVRVFAKGTRFIYFSISSFSFNFIEFNYFGNLITRWNEQWTNRFDWLIDWLIDWTGKLQRVSLGGSALAGRHRQASTSQENRRGNTGGGKKFKVQLFNRSTQQQLWLLTYILFIIYYLLFIIYYLLFINYWL